MALCVQGDGPPCRNVSIAVKNMEKTNKKKPTPFDFVFSEYNPPPPPCYVPFLTA